MLQLLAEIQADSEEAVEAAEAEAGGNMGTKIEVLKKPVPRD